MTTNPFTYGNPISDPIRFFGREREIEQIFSRLRNAEFESSSIVGERRIGKTSLLNYIAHSTILRRKGLDPAKFLFVDIDLSMTNEHETPTLLWKRLLRQMGRKCQDAEVKHLIEEARQMDDLDTFVLADVFDSVDEKGLYIVLLLDEFDHITNNSNFAPSFFYGLRSLAIHHHLALVTSSRSELVELCHSEALRSSPFFNIFSTLTLRPFNETEAKLFISSSLGGTETCFTENEINVILRLAGNHPYFLQMACFYLFEAYTKSFNALDRTALLNRSFPQEAASQLGDYWYASNDQEKIVLTALALLEKQGKVGERTFHVGKLQALYTRSDQTLGLLEKRGLLVITPGGYTLVNETLGEWIRLELTDTMHDQQHYDAWLRSNAGIIQKIPRTAKKEITDILPRISSRYRDLIVAWVCDPRNMIAVAALLRTALNIR